MNESIVFYRSFMEAASVLPAEEYKEAVSAVLSYGLDGIEPENLSPYAKMFYLMAKPQIDANNARREAGRKSGESRRNKANAGETEASPDNIPVCYAETDEQSSNKAEQCSSLFAETDEQTGTNVNVNANANVNANVNAKGTKETAQAAPAHTSAQKPEQQKKAYGEFENVKLTETERKRLNERLGEQRAAEYIERLGEYLKSKGKRYSSHYATILTWHRRDGTPVGDGSGQAIDKNAQPGFDAFWEAYPKHSGIDDAKREWAALAPDEELRENILRAVAWRKGTEPWKDQQGKFIPAPAKWLHDHGWTDYKPPQRSGTVYEGMGPRDPDVEENWDAIMGEQIKAIRGY